MNKLIDTVHHFFIPRHSNNFKAKLIHHDLLTLYLLFALTLTIGISQVQQHSGSILGFATDISAPKLLELTNVERQNAGLPLLTHNDQLAAAAEKKAQDMFEKGYWSHYGPSGETPWEFILGAGYQYEYAGENLAKNFLFSDGVVSAWMDSQTHKENILRRDYTHVGFAVVNGVLNGEETTLVVQMFGTPLYGAAPAQEKQPVAVEQVPVQETAQPAAQPQTQVLADQNESMSFYPAFLNINILFYGALIFALLLDFYFASKLNLIHIKGKNLIHILFLGSIMIGTLILIKGSII